MLGKLKQKLKDQRGLTLIELLAVIVILGIIAAIAIPSIGNIINNSKYGAVKSDAIMLINAAKLYQSDNGKIPADASEITEYVDGDSTLPLDNTVTFKEVGKNIAISGTGKNGDKITVKFTDATIKKINESAKKYTANIEIK